MALKDSAEDVDGAFTREGNRGLSFENAFGGALSFMRRRYTKDLTGVDLAITGIPFDQAVTNRPGARFGPRAIREASTLQPCDPPYGWDIDPLSEFDLIDYGDLSFDYGRVQEFPQALQDHIARILARDVGTIAFGGDHYVSYPMLKAYAEKFGSISLLQFDAHTDTWADGDESRIDHGTMFYKAVKAGVVSVAHSVQVGIRTLNPETLGVPIIDAPEVHASPMAAVAKIKRILEDRPVYLTFDIDCLDPAFAPGTGTPVAGGLSSAQALAMLRALTGINMVGGDVVEVSPSYDASGATAIAASQVAMELCCLYCSNLKEKRHA